MPRKPLLVSTQGASWWYSNHLKYLNMKELWYNSELTPVSKTLYLISKTEPVHPLPETLFGCLYSWPLSFNHYPKLTTIGDAWNVDWLVNWKIFHAAQLPFHHNCLVQHLYYFWYSTNPPVNLTLHFTLTNVKDLEILELLHLGLQLIPNSKEAIHHFLAVNCGLGLRGADSHRSYFTCSCRLPQCTLKVMVSWIQ